MQTVRCRIVLSFILVFLFFLTACQQITSPDSNIYNPDTDFETTASTVDKADLGNRVWIDANGDGIKQTPENGFRGVVVNLWTDSNADGTPEDKIATQTTDAGGFYRFNAIDPDINYILQIEAPNGFSFSPKNNPNASSNDRDSDINSNGLSDSIDIGAGRYNYFTDAALKTEGGTPPEPIKLSRLGDRIWQDLNGDGLKQSNEPGFKNVKVNLWIDNNKNGSPDSIIKTDTTNANGYYFFNALDSAKQYFVEVEIPDGYKASPKNNPAASSVDKDSDLNQNGISNPLNLFPLRYTYWIDGGLVKGDVAPVDKPLKQIASISNVYGEFDFDGNSLAVFNGIENAFRFYEPVNGTWQESFSFDVFEEIVLPQGAINYFDGPIRNLFWQDGQLTFQHTYSLSNSTPLLFDTYVFRRENSSWIQEAKFTWTNPFFRPNLDGNILTLKNNSGILGIYEKVNNAWVKQDEFLLEGGLISNNRILLTSLDGTKLYTLIYEKVNGTWQETERILQRGFHVFEGNTLIKAGNATFDPARPTITIYNYDDSDLQEEQTLLLEGLGSLDPILDEDRLIINYTKRIQEPGNDPFATEVVSREILVYEKQAGNWQRIDSLAFTNNPLENLLFDAKDGRIAIQLGVGTETRIAIYE